MFRITRISAILTLAAVFGAGCTQSATPPPTGPITDAAAGDPANVQPSSTPAAGASSQAPTGPGAAVVDPVDTDKSTPQ
jgi:hypothetical protein